MADINAIKELLDQQKKDIVADITAKIDNIDDKLNGVIETVNKHTDQLNNDHEPRIKKLEEDLKKALDKQDDIINRSLRNNIVVKGLAGDEANWEDTRTRIGELFGKLDDNKRADDFYHGLIERAHRQGKKEEGKTRTVYARLYCSENVKLVVKQARLAKIKDKRYPIRIEHQYSEALQDRRNEAMLKRRELLDGGMYTNIYVEYPAKLMGKKEDWQNYKHIEDF